MGKKEKATMKKEDACLLPNPRVWELGKENIYHLRGSSILRGELDFN